MTPTLHVQIDSHDDVWTCECGSEAFIIRRDGTIECACCELIAEEIIAVPSPSSVTH